MFQLFFYLVYSVAANLANHVCSRVFLNDIKFRNDSLNCLKWAVENINERTMKNAWVKCWCAFFSGNISNGCAAVVIEFERFLQIDVTEA